MRVLILPLHLESAVASGPSNQTKMKQLLAKGPGQRQSRILKSRIN